MRSFIKPGAAFAAAMAAAAVLAFTRPAEAQDGTFDDNGDGYIDARELHDVDGNGLLSANERLALRRYNLQMTRGHLHGWAPPGFSHTYTGCIGCSAYPYPTVSPVWRQRFAYSLDTYNVYRPRVRWIYPLSFTRPSVRHHHWSR